MHISSVLEEILAVPWRGGLKSAHCTHYLQYVIKLSRKPEKLKDFIGLLCLNIILIMLTWH